jgi:hypothetical protein
MVHPAATRCAADIRAILSRRHDNGGDFWASADGRIYVGHPFSTLGALGMLHELGVAARHPAVRGALALIREAGRPDGRIQVAPKAPLYPCYTAEAARVLCRFGLTGDPAVRRTVAYLLTDAHASGGWRCGFTRFGHGPETMCANPGATLFALDVLRFLPAPRRGGAVVDRAVDSLLDHWDVRRPIGPCHYGIGTLFLQVEFPFLRYNLFYYLYVLSFFARARRDRRFRAALAVLDAKLSESGDVVVERPHRDLKDLEFCAQGRPSAAATARYTELRRNLKR